MFHRHPPYQHLLELCLGADPCLLEPGTEQPWQPEVAPLAVIMDLISSIINQPSSFYEAAQLPNVAEYIMAEEFCERIGYDPDTSTMVLTSGRALANMTAILAARNQKFPQIWQQGTPEMEGPKPAIAMSSQAHYSNRRLAGMIGIGEDQVVYLPVNEQGQIDPEGTEDSLAEARNRGLQVFCMIATLGTPSRGVLDPIDRLAEIAAAHNLWLHVDGALGGNLIVSDRLRSQLGGIEKADSFLLDAHKLLTMPGTCSLLFYKDKKASYGAFQQDASYVFEKQPNKFSAFDSAKQNLECTKRPMIMGLWVSWICYGSSVFAQRIEYLYDLTKQAYHLLRHLPDFETIQEPSINILCFRYTTVIPDHEQGEFHETLCQRLQTQGYYFLSTIMIHEKTAMRVVFDSHRTNLSHFEAMVQDLRDLTQEPALVQAVQNAVA
ncbi:MAG: aminotransferase class V-fold PLP-dependent enzyme [Bacteroidota bacterium]